MGLYERVAHECDPHENDRPINTCTRYRTVLNENFLCVLSALCVDRAVMRRFRVTLAYDGTDFVGWQRQASGTSIQGLLEEALRAFDDRDVAVVGAGRTDAGVHALGQAAAFSLDRAIDADTIVRALNANLPEAVRVLSSRDVAP